jgi:hypothetical protein
MRLQRLAFVGLIATFTMGATACQNQPTQSTCATRGVLAQHRARCAHPSE